MKKLYFISCGTGHPEDITIRAHRLINRCEVLLGSKRLTAIFAPDRQPVILPAQSARAAAIINSRREDIIGVLLSGDAGFYSQAAQLRTLITGREIITIPGLSIVQSAAAKLNIPWQDLRTVSMHAENTAPRIKNNTLILMRKGIDLHNILAGKLKEADIWILKAVGMPEEQILKWDGTPYVCTDLCTVAIIKKAPDKPESDRL